MHYIYYSYVFMRSCTYLLTYLHSWLGAYKTRQYLLNGWRYSESYH